MLMQEYVLKLKFLEPVLGSQSTRDVMSEFVYKDSLPEDEAVALPRDLERGTTVFHKDAESGQIHLLNYMLKGFLKESARIQNGMKGNPKNFRSKIENCCFVLPRKLYVYTPEGKKATETEFLERPLRAMTAQGPRVALARSEQLPDGCYLYAKLHVLAGSEVNDLKLIKGLLAYGRFQGLGQWRSGGYGTFAYQIEPGEQYEMGEDEDQGVEND